MVKDKIYITDNLIGQGGYGSVYDATDKKGNEIVCKKCKFDENGIPDILEASIMNTFDHPNISSAIQVFSKNGYLHLLQKKGLCDLNKHCRGDGADGLNLLKKWCGDIAKGLEAMHRNNIIHCDIKPSNLILFEGDVVKITDFTLSIKKWDEEKFYHGGGTNLYRPIESFLGDGWSYPSDIWSLGCTFYYLAYGRTLMPNQGNVDKDLESHLNSNEKKKRNKKRYVNALLDWGKYNPYVSDDYMDTKKYDLNYEKFRLVDKFTNSEYSEFNDLIMKMLRINQEDRITIEEVLKHPFLRDTPKVDFCLKYPRPEKKKGIEKIWKSREYKKLLDCEENDTIVSITKDLIYQVYGKKHWNNEIVVAGCYWIARKILRREPKILFKNKVMILNMELQICELLQYRIHDFIKK